MLIKIEAKEENKDPIANLYSCADVNNIILEYLGNEITVAGQTSLYRGGSSFFESITQLLTAQALQAANYILCGDADKALALVQKNESILSPIVELNDPHGNRVRGKLLQIAAMAGDFNVRKKDKEDYGIVERLSRHLSKEEVAKQLQLVFPIDWERAMEARMRPYVSALNQFFERLIQATPCTGETLKDKCKITIEAFRVALKPKPNQVITTGYIFDLQIFRIAIELFENERNLQALGGWYSDKSDIFWVNGFGSLQARASICDLQVMRKGLYKVMEDGEILDRTLNFSSGVPRDLRGLGLSVLFNLVNGARYGARVRAGASECAGGWARSCSRRFFQNLCGAKTSARSELISRPDSSKAGCFVM